MRTYSLIVMLFSIIFLSGCAPTADLGPTVDHRGRPRSLALDSSWQHLLSGGQASGWWDSRNNYVRTAVVEQDGLLLDVSEQTTWDRLNSHGGRIDDHFNQRTRKTRIRQHIP